MPGCIQVTDATREALEDRYVVESRGEIDVKGRGMLEVFMLRGRKDRSAAQIG